MNEKIRRDITDAIIARIEKDGVLPWQCPFEKGTDEPFIPYNYQTGSPYHGMNVFLLWETAYVNNFSRNAWLTLKQANAIGGKVRKGEKSQACFFYKSVPIEPDEQGNVRDIPILNRFNVFNIEQIDNLGEIEHALTDVQPGTNAGRLFDDGTRYCKNEGIKIMSRQDGAFYRPATDAIGMPSKDKFNDVEAMASTFAHEIIHSTGSNSRLDRLDVSGRDEEWNTHYAYEELIAEIGASFLCADYNIISQIDNSERYLKHWLKGFTDHSSLLFKAASEASKAMLYFSGSCLVVESEDDNESETSGSLGKNTSVSNP